MAYSMLSIFTGCCGILMIRHFAIVIASLATFTSWGTLAQPDLYLRCDCNWWKAEEQYRLQETSRQGVYRTRMELSAVGFPISFKLVDKEYSSGNNYGYLTSNDKEIRLGRVAKARDSAIREYFEFNPAQDGAYRFYLDLSGSTPLVFVLPD
jgi:hypothetical protein